MKDSEHLGEGAGTGGCGMGGGAPTLLLRDICLQLLFIFKHFCRTCGITVCMRRRIRLS